MKSSSSVDDEQHWSRCGLQAVAAVNGSAADMKISEIYDQVFNRPRATRDTKGDFDNASGMHHRAQLSSMMRMAPCGKLVTPNSPCAWYVDRVLVELGLSDGWTRASSSNAHPSAPEFGRPIDWTALRQRYPQEKYDL